MGIYSKLFKIFGVLFCFLTISGGLGEVPTGVPAERMGALLVTFLACLSFLFGIIAWKKGEWKKKPKIN